VHEVLGYLIVVSSALLGVLTFVFQGLVRGYVANIMIVAEDRYAINDWVEIDGVKRWLLTSA